MADFGFTNDLTNTLSPFTLAQQTPMASPGLSALYGPTGGMQNQAAGQLGVSGNAITQDQILKALGMFGKMPMAQQQQPHQLMNAPMASKMQMPDYSALMQQPQFYQPTPVAGLLGG